jgi:hypothetical protein
VVQFNLGFSVSVKTLAPSKSNNQLLITFLPPLEFNLFLEYLVNQIYLSNLLKNQRKIVKYLIFIPKFNYSKLVN